MPFPEFEPGKKKLLFFSRGRGRGHAIPDIEIAKQIEKIDPRIEVRFVSYATGARTLEKFGYPIIDIGQPENSSIADVTVLAGHLIGWLKPDLVVSHEEFATLPVAKVFNRRTIFITDFFSDPNQYAMDSLRFADEILFTGEPGVFDEPKFLAGKITYVGPIIREFSYSLADRPRAREELGIPADALVVSVLPGSWTERQSPVFDNVVGAFDLLKARSKRLIWIAGDDCEILTRRTDSRPDVMIFEWEPVIERIMVASDVAINKASRVTARELAHIGVPAIALSHGHNPNDDRIVESLEGGSFCRAEGLSAFKLCELISVQFEKMRARGPLLAPPPVAGSTQTAARQCADCLAKRISNDPPPSGDS